MSRSSLILKNTLIQGVSQVLTWSLTWVLLKVLPTHLGEAGFGRFFFALSFGMIFSAFTNLGIDTWLTRAVATGGTEESPKPVADALGLRLLLCLASFLAQAAVIHWMPYDAELRGLVLILAVASAMDALTQTFGSVFLGANRMLAPAGSLVLSKTALTLLVCLCVSRGGDAQSIAWAHVASSALGLFASAGMLWKAGLLSVRFDPAALAATAKLCLPFTVWIIFGAIYLRISVMMLSLMCPEPVLGWFGAAFRLYGTMLFLPHILNTSVFPTLARMGLGDEDKALAQASERMLAYVLLVSVPMGIGGAMIAGPLLHLLYGSSFEGARLPLQIFCVSSIVVCANVFLCSLLIAKGREKPWAGMAVAAAVFNPLMNLWLIPLGSRLCGNGAAGAAAATLLTELLMFAGALRLLPPGLLGPRGWMIFAKTLLASLAMLAGLLLAPPPNLVLSVLAGAAYYAAAAFALRALPREHWAHLVHTLSHWRNS